tara:strand:- start:105 stop:356 length:252 start_codon:yes stop_codon:yes gene_type:complete
MRSIYESISKTYRVVMEKYEVAILSALFASGCLAIGGFEYFKANEFHKGHIIEKESSEMREERFREVDELGEQIIMDWRLKER